MMTVIMGSLILMSILFRYDNRTVFETGYYRDFLGLSLARSFVRSLIRSFIVSASLEGFSFCDQVVTVLVSCQIFSESQRKTMQKNEW